MEKDALASVYKFNNLDITVILHDALTMLAILYCWVILINVINMYFTLGAMFMSYIFF